MSEVIGSCFCFGDPEPEVPAVMPPPRGTLHFVRFSGRDTWSVVQVTGDGDRGDWIDDWVDMIGSDEGYRWRDVEESIPIEIPSRVVLRG